MCALVVKCVAEYLKSAGMYILWLLKVQNFSVSLIFLSGVIESGAFKAVRQGQWHHFSAPVGGPLSEPLMI